jgi:hypothetical protein
VHWIWIVSLVALVLVLVFGSEAVRRQTAEVYLVRTLGLVGAAFAMIAIGGLLTFVAWWLRTWRNERLRPALVFLAGHVPWFGMLAAAIGVSVYLEDHSQWPHLLALAAGWVVAFAIGTSWYRWAHPAVVRVLLQASHGALRAGVAVLAIAVSVLATGSVWAYVNPRVVPTPPEFEVPATDVRNARLAMLRYKIAALDCSIARITIERDVMHATST